MTEQVIGSGERPTESMPHPVSPMSGEPPLIEMEVFRAGNYGAKGLWSEEDLEQLARDYAPGLHEAPLTFDHARSGPAFGWVVRLRRAGDRLVATLTGVPKTVRQLIRCGAYKKRSVEIIRKFTATGRPYLRAVSLLGAASPEVKGLRDVAFGDPGEEVVHFEMDAEDSESPGRVTRESEGEHCSRDLGAEIAKLHRALRRKSVENLFARLRAVGRVISPERAELLATFIDALAPEATIVFRGRELEPEQWLTLFLSAEAPAVPLGEEQIPPRPANVAESVVAFSERVDPASVALHKRAMALCAHDASLSYAEALSRAARQSGNENRNTLR